MAHESDSPGEHEHTITLRVDGRERRCTVDVRTTILDALRDRLGIYSPKKGCEIVPRGVVDFGSARGMRGDQRVAVNTMLFRSSRSTTTLVR